MKRSVLFPVLIALLFLPSVASAQPKKADLYGYEKPDYVRGIFSANPDGNSFMLIGLRTVYDKPLGVYVTRSFDQSQAFKVGEVPPGQEGDIVFETPALDMRGYDSVLLMVPEWTVPVGLGLLE